MRTIESNVRRIGWAVTAVALVLCPEISRADEDGVSFWLPGHFSSLAATPQVPGWSMAEVSHHCIGIWRCGRGKRDYDRQVLADR
jgi:hypothetical protein